MELLNENEINIIAKKCGCTKVLTWTFEELEDKIVGYLGDHLNLIVKAESNCVKKEIKLFVKCMPRFDKWKAEYLKELLFFKTEFIMLSSLFNLFQNPEDLRKWRPKLLFIKEDIFVFENVSLQGYAMPHHQKTLRFDELRACVETLARFHSQSYVFEEKKTKELGRPFRIWEHYSEYLQEPCKGADWRNTGRNAVMDFLKVFSKFKTIPNFSQYLECTVPELYDRAVDLMKPSTEYRNVVVHRDLWTNNIFLKKTNEKYHAMFVDFQTVIYCSPMLDLSSIIYFNTSRADRDSWTNKLIDIYYDVMSSELNVEGVNIEDIFDKKSMREAYEKSLTFALTQAGLITPIVAMNKYKREEIFCNPDLSVKVNIVSRSEEFIEIAKQDDKYRIRLTELFDELVERFVIPNGVKNLCNYDV